MGETTDALIALEDGRVFRGRSFGAPGERCGEVVFNTSMTGYQEILTDPSYAGQIVTMTYPLIGNYGVNTADPESGRIQAEGLIVKECCRVPSNWRASQSLPDYLRAAGVLGIEGVDTRALTLHIRTAGAMKAAISTLGTPAEKLVAKAQAWPGLVGRDMVQHVTCARRYEWMAAGAESEASATTARDGAAPASTSQVGSPRFRVVVYDFGCKHNILRSLAERGCQVTVVPATTSAADALALDPDGILLSNGPGDPAGVPHIVAEVRKLLGRCPIFGICLGHQILALALGGKSYKLKFGHRGANHPVREVTGGRVAITSQNHGFCVDAESLPPGEVTTTHINLNDGTLEGFRHRTLPILAIQYHPEAAPGPHDASRLFDNFLDMMTRRPGVAPCKE